MVEGVNGKVIKNDNIGPLYEKNLHHRSLEFKSFKLIPLCPYLGIKAIGGSYLSNVSCTSWKTLPVYMVAGIKRSH